jgi:hypothetical protein
VSFGAEGIVQVCDGFPIYVARLAPPVAPVKLPGGVLACVGVRSGCRAASSGAGIQ